MTFKVASDATKPEIKAAPYDRGLVDIVKNAFPTARWDAQTRTWVVPGVRALKRAQVWAAEHAGAAQAAADERTAIAAARIAEAAAVPADAIRSSHVRRDGAVWAVRVPYDAATVAELKAIPAARWDAAARAWTVPVRSTEALAAAMPAIERRAKAARPRATQAQRTPEDAAPRARRILVHSRTHRTGDVLRRGDEVLVVSDLGKVFRIDSEAACLYGLFPDDHWMQAYVRPATDAETEALVAREATAAGEGRLS